MTKAKSKAAAEPTTATAEAPDPVTQGWNPERVRRLMAALDVNGVGLAAMIGVTPRAAQKWAWSESSRPSKSTVFALERLEEDARGSSGAAGRSKAKLIAGLRKGDKIVIRWRTGTNAATFVETSNGGADVTVRNGSGMVNVVTAADVVSKSPFFDVKPARLKTMLKSLSPRQAEVISRRYGLGDGDPETLDEIGVSLGITKQRVQQIEAEALRSIDSGKLD